MLIDFAVENFRSIAAKQTFSMLPAKGATNVHKTDSTFAPEVMKAAALYGANGAGKSTLVAALTWLQTLVRESGTYNSDDKLVYDPHLLDSAFANKPTSMELRFAASEAIWRYKVETNATEIVEESLFSRSFSTNREKKIFVRSRGEIGPEIADYTDILKTKTNKNQLYLSKLDQFSADEIEPAYNWIVVTLRIISSISGFPKSVTADWCKDDHNKSSVVTFLKAVDTRVEDISVVTDTLKVDPASIDRMFKGRSEPIFEFDTGSIKHYNLRFFHKNTDKGLTSLPIDVESLGTRNLFSLAGPLLQSLIYGFVLVIDEMNQSFHTEVLRFIVDLFYSVEANTENSQLIFTSHDVSIMDLLERDQIWLVEKNPVGASELIAISDFGPTREGGARRRAPFGRQYLENRFGGLPFTDRILLVNVLHSIRDRSLERHN